ncbi:arginyltransferase [Azospirillum rugosum]|uniref:Aspartate/glutamate leucyltransferase n=1 Tax=Azospirillum rugosum TaxID=416170 RepID=A0ABS4SPH0_9PROT|nr:arginyltransferase [Azospirillum rugosum]MBP2294437.1 arginine-tRNA-protein transferase [Azospirillum rugosum]MDQ0528942.1 arginine-tRNA-protein transferase [Azospirillum rugosum]
MSVIQPQHRPLQQFFRSGPMPCPYLPGRVERKLFTRLLGPYSAEVNSTLSRAGFRRSHDIVYRPVCPNCQACVPVRIPVATFEASRSQKRVARINQDLRLNEAPAVATGEQYRLFATYQNSRHGESDMARMAMADFAAMIDEGRADTSLFEARDAHGRLVGCMLTDRLTDGFSAVYSFYDARQDRRSLGTHMILSLIERAQAEGLPYVYLGYWIEQSRKMAYKAKFRPLEALGRDGWYRLPEDANR